MLANEMARNWWVNDSGEMTLRGAPQWTVTDGTVFRAEFEAQRYALTWGQTATPWVDNSGNPGDPTNPMHLEDNFILHALRTIAKAREDFNKVLPTLGSQEQDRLNNLIARCPYVLTPARDTRDEADDLMHKFNTAGIRTTGPRGGYFGGP